IGAAELVDLLLAQRHRLGNRSAGDIILGADHGGVAALRDGAEIGEGLAVVGHQLPTLFLRFIAAMSRTSGFCAAWGCSGPAKMRRLRICWRPSGPRGIIRSIAFSSTRSGKRPSRILAAVTSLSPPT